MFNSIFLPSIDLFNIEANILMTILFGLEIIIVFLFFNVMIPVIYIKLSKLFCKICKGVVTTLVVGLVVIQQQVITSFGILPFTLNIELLSIIIGFILCQCYYNRNRKTVFNKKLSGMKTKN